MSARLVHLKPFLLLIVEKPGAGGRKVFDGLGVIGCSGKVGNGNGGNHGFGMGYAASDRLHPLHRLGVVAASVYEKRGHAHAAWLVAMQGGGSGRHLHGLP